MFYIGSHLYSTLVAVIVEGGGYLDMVGSCLIIVGGRVSGIVCGRLGG